MVERTLQELFVLRVPQAGSVAGFDIQMACVVETRANTLSLVCYLVTFTTSIAKMCGTVQCKVHKLSENLSVGGFV